MTLVRAAGCETKIGASCVYAYESYTVERDGRCADQTAPSGERLASCEEVASARTAARVVGIAVAVVAGAAVTVLAAGFLLYRGGASAE